MEPDQKVIQVEVFLNKLLNRTIINMTGQFNMIHLNESN